MIEVVVYSKEINLLGCDVSMTVLLLIDNIYRLYSTKFMIDKMLILIYV